MPKVGIWLRPSDAYLLRLLVIRATEDVQRHVRENREGMSEDALNRMKIHEAQLRTCLDEIEKKIS